MNNIEEYQKTFAIRLQDLRQEQNFKQEVLAEKLGISTVTMSRLENGTTTPKFDILIKLSQIFNVSIDYLVGLSENKKIIKNKPKVGRSVVSEKRESVEEIPPKPFNFPW